MRKAIVYFTAVYFLFLGCLISANYDSSNIIYYVNNRTGNDSNIGTSINSPWKTLKKLEGITFQPGDSILFDKESEFIGGIKFNYSGNEENPIVLSSYGNGLFPSFSNPNQNEFNGNVFQISGSYIIIDGLSFSKCANANSKNDKRVLETGAVFTK